MISTKAYGNNFHHININDNYKKQNDEKNHLHLLKWSMGHQPGSGELRDIALLKLIECQNTGNSFLDLSGLGLRSLPDVLPQHITQLNLTDNQLTNLPDNLPLQLQQIEIANNPLSSKTIEELRARAATSQQDLIISISPKEEPTGEESVVLIDDDDYQNHGRWLRKEAEKMRSCRELAQQIAQPPMLWKAAGVLLGLAVTTGAGYYFLRQTSSKNQHDSDLPRETANGLRMQPDALPDFVYPRVEALAAQSDLANLSTTTAQAVANATQPLLLSESEAIAQELIHFFRKESGLFIGGEPRKEALVASVAYWLFPTGSPYEPEGKVKTLARIILRTTNHYGGKEDEKLTLQTAKDVIRRWVFNTILHAPLREYIATKIITDKYPSYFTLDSIKKLLSLPNIYFDGQFVISDIPAAMWGNLNAMWHTFIREEIPVLDFQKFSEQQNISFFEFDFLALCTGAEYLADMQILHKFTPPEIISIGASIWGNMISQSANIDMLPYLITPSLWYAAETKPESLKNVLNKRGANYVMSVVTMALEDWRANQEQAIKLEKAMNAWTEAMKGWATRGDLADKIIATCDPNDILYAQPYTNINEKPGELAKKKREAAKERYLLWGSFPCEKVTTNLNEEYRKLTSRAADTYRELDNILLNITLSSADKTDLDFIFSPTVRIHPAWLHMRTHRTTASFPGGGVASNDIFIEPNNADFFAVHKNNEDRIYVLKRGDEVDSGYKLHRIDKNFNLYVKYGVLSYPHLWKDYTIKDEKIYAGGYEFSFSININPAFDLSGRTAQGNSLLAESFSQQHRNNFYNNLYEKGNDKSKTEILWDTVKHIVPFYDCMEGLASGKPLEVSQGMVSCMLDALALIPAAGQAAAISGKFGISLARGMRSGIFKISQGASSTAVARAIAKNIVLPTHKEMQELLKSTLQAFNPFFEFQHKANVRAGRASATINDSKLAEKFRQNIPAEIDPPKTVYKTATLSESGQTISIKKTGKNNWVRVNPQTGEASGRYYHLNNSKLNKVEISNKRRKSGDTGNTSKQQGKCSNPEPILATKNYNEMPPAPGKAEFWNTIREVEKNPATSHPPAQQHTSIQKLESFIPEQPLHVIDVEAVTEYAYAESNSQLAPHPWRAFAGISSAVSGEVPAYIASLQAQLHQSFEESLQTFEKARNKLWELANKEIETIMQSDAGIYLSGLLDTKNPKIIQEAIKRITVIVERGDVFFKASKANNYDNVVIISTELKPDPENPEKYISPLDEDEIENLNFAYVSLRDPEVRIFIHADKHYRKSPSLFAGITNQKFNFDSPLSETLNHEVTHLTSQTKDMFIAGYPCEGQLSSAKDLKEMFMYEISTRDKETDIRYIFNNKDFRNFFKQLRKSQGISKHLTHGAIFKAIESDPMLCANVLLTDAEIVSTIVRDLAANNAWDAVITDPRTKRSATHEQGPDLSMPLLTLVARLALRTEEGQETVKDSTEK